MHGGTEVVIRRRGVVLHDLQHAGQTQGRITALFSLQSRTSHALKSRSIDILGAAVASKGHFLIVSVKGSDIEVHACAVKVALVGRGGRQVIHAHVGHRAPVVGLATAVLSVAPVRILATHLQTRTRQDETRTREEFMRLGLVPVASETDTEWRTI